MALTLADQYYIKALAGYGYDLEEVVENLNYALSYDHEHSGANYLMGKVYMEQFQKFDLAQAYLRLHWLVTLQVLIRVRVLAGY